MSATLHHSAFKCCATSVMASQTARGISCRGGFCRAHETASGRTTAHKRRQRESFVHSEEQLLNANLYWRGD